MQGLLKSSKIQNKFDTQPAYLQEPTQAHEYFIKDERDSLPQKTDPGRKFKREMIIVDNADNDPVDASINFKKSINS
jgi:hypothetical protein